VEATPGKRAAEIGRRDSAQTPQNRRRVVVTDRAVIAKLFDRSFGRQSIYDNEPDQARLEKITSYVERYSERYRTALLSMDKVSNILLPVARTRIEKSPFFVVPDQNVNAQVALINDQRIVVINGGLLSAIRFQFQMARLTARLDASSHKENRQVRIRDEITIEVTKIL
jgi:hypothetical protein